MWEPICQYSRVQANRLRLFLWFEEVYVQDTLAFVLRLLNRVGIPHPQIMLFGHHMHTKDPYMGCCFKISQFQSTTVLSLALSYICDYRQQFTLFLTRHEQMHDSFFEK